MILNLLKESLTEIQKCVEICDKLEGEEKDSCTLGIGGSFYINLQQLCYHLRKGCYYGNGFHLYDRYHKRGVCYPDACSAGELLILQSNVVPREISQPDSKGSKSEQVDTELQHIIDIPCKLRAGHCLYN